jgi:hypothetical protein
MYIVHELQSSFQRHKLQTTTKRNEDKRQELSRKGEEKAPAPLPKKESSDRRYPDRCLVGAGQKPAGFAL